MDKSFKVFVGGLPVRVDREAIAEFFATYGTVLNCKLKKNQQTGRSLGFAYLTVKEKAAYDRLLSEPVIFQGRVIDVKPMWKKKELGDKLEEEKKKKIFVSNLPQDLTNSELMAYFSKFGQVANAFIIKDPDTEGYKDYGYVVFKDLETIDRIINQAFNLVIGGQPLSVERCTNIAQIALSKQTSSLRSSKPNSYLPKGSADPLESPLLGETSPMFDQGKSSISAFISGKSTASQGKDLCSTFCLFGPPVQPKSAGTISKFGDCLAAKQKIGSSKENPTSVSEVGSGFKLQTNLQTEKQSFIIKAPSALRRKPEYQEDSSRILSTKESILEECSKLNQRETNYAFHFKPSSRRHRQIPLW